MKPNIQSWDITKLTPYELNAKVHDPAQVARIAKSIKEFGWTQPIVVDQNGSIIAGHGRRLAAVSLGMTKVPVWVRDDLNEQQVRALRLADNRVAISNLDVDILQKELADLDFDLEGIFDKKELDFVVADLGELDVSAFVDDLDDEIRLQGEETKKTLAAAAEKDVQIAKALGFKSIKGADERAVAMAMALIEEDTKMQGADAFVEFCKTMAGIVSHN